MFRKISLGIFATLLTFIGGSYAFAQETAEKKARSEKQIENAIREFYAAHEINQVRRVGSLESVDAREDRITIRLKDGAKLSGPIVAYGCDKNAFSVDSFFIVDESKGQLLVPFANVKEIKRERYSRYIARRISDHFARRAKRVKNEAAIPVYLLSGGLVDLANLKEWN